MGGTARLQKSVFCYFGADGGWGSTEFEFITTESLFRYRDAGAGLVGLVSDSARRRAWRWVPPTWMGILLADSRRSN